MRSAPDAGTLLGGVLTYLATSLQQAARWHWDTCG